MFKKENSPPNLLQDCLEALENEGETVDNFLSRRPEQAEKLRPALQAADWLRERRQALEPRPGFVCARPAWLFCQMRKAESIPMPDLRAAQPFSWRRFLGRLCLVGLLLAAGFLVANRSLAASRTWLPGDPVYPLKSAQEAAALFFATNPAKKASLHAEFACRRLLEAQALTFEGRYDQLPGAVAGFSSQLEAAVLETQITAEDNPDRGAFLATQLEQALEGQAGLIQILATSTPQPGCDHLHQLLHVSQNGLDELQGLLTIENQG
jgi:hypothetical protein